MKLKLSLLILVILQFSCKDKTEKQIENTNSKSSKVELHIKEANRFDFEKFKISKGQVGEIKVGMDLGKAEKLLKQLTKKEAEAYDFGFDGGGKAYLYSLDDEFIIGLIPKADSKEILAIVALSKNLKTSNGLNPKSTVSEIQKKYPTTKIVQNLMMDWQFIEDEKNNWEFILMTGENEPIGEFNDSNTEIKSDWITIK
ncbi:hypothetical protein [Flavobacterium sp. ENC]|uniref:hypothetical protein n=1 Tax=Flavobacterium sp. ENC TaxID=2897330 RepID=UPI001E45ED6E|nr:hypothetical protein [Flavobacterium sp. ENC]MCD0466127.1 hypothetical protein [Flavobacterium sp. ENC]